MNAEADDVLQRVARLADELGPRLVPAGHRDLLRSITDAARELFEAAACSVALLDGNELVFHAASGAGADAVEGMRMPASRGIAGWVVTAGQAIAIEHVSSDPRFAADVARSTGYVPQSILAMPLETQEDVIGVISVLDRRTESGSGPRDMELLALFARQAALAVDNSRVFSDLGRALLEALGLLSDGMGLGESLTRVGADGSERTAELAQLAASFEEIARADPEAHRAAVALLSQFRSYLRSRHRLRAV
jgi:GAF domain-containing protein